MAEPTRRSERIKVPSKRKSLAQSSFEAAEWQSEDQDNSNENENEGCSQGSKSSTAQRGQAEEEWKAETEENDSGCVSEGPSHKLKRSPAKRMRRSSKTASAKKLSKETQDKGKARQKKRRRDLSLLPTMPLDIIFAICSILTPRDLINLSRVDAKFCRTLTVNNVSFVWKAVREIEGGIEPPQDIPEYRWVDLLFGVSACDVCDTRHVRVDWMLRRRICRRCLKPNLIYEPRVAKLFPGADAEVLSLIPHTNTGITTFSKSSRFYWGPDIDEIMAKLDRLKSDRKTGSSKHLSGFVKERKDLVKDILKHAEKCLEWKAQYEATKADESEQLMAERYQEIKSRLLELGYTQDDMSAIRWCNSVRKSAKLTSSSWKKILPGLEDTIAQHRDMVAKYEYSRALQRRTDILKTLYTSYQHGFVPSVWKQMPPYMDVCMFAAFKSVLESPTKDQITESSFSHAMEELPNLIAAWQQDRATRVRNLAVAELGLVNTTVDATTLAICVFGCSNRCHNYSGTYADLWRHRCHLHRSYIYWDFGFQNVDNFYECRGNGDITFDSRRSAMASSLVTMVSRDPATTTIEEMDSLGDTFLCMDCPVNMFRIGSGDILFGRPLLTWRQCINIHSHSGPTKVRPLTTEEQSKLQEVELDPDMSSTWSCQHCSEYLEQWTTHESVSRHVQDVHGVNDPVIERDLFVAPGFTHGRHHMVLRALEFQKPPGYVYPYHV
ncbi:hypothetical protein ARMSODRAFT_932426 [Armillaria solidipes]|uniref:F-box domain-containing protein n=1 Tax=Armillaria solidipes TaxID=1076256 RepID=A0A2H3BT36_9AGAR|nr:hypothetical protein ARMSODRAFT_932426 [Armillaria solidipes]